LHELLQGLAGDLAEQGEDEVSIEEVAFAVEVAAGGEGCQRDVFGARFTAVRGDREHRELGEASGLVVIGDHGDLIGSDHQRPDDRATAAEVDRRRGPRGDRRVGGDDDERHRAAEARVRAGDVDRPRPVLARVDVGLGLDDEGLGRALPARRR
jgi:hypothetical protein